MNNRLTGALASVALCTSLGAHAFTIDLSGVTVDGLSPFNTFVVSNANVAPAATIDFVFVYDAGDNGSVISWGSELVLEIGHLDSETYAQIGTQEGGCAVVDLDCDFDLMWTDESGIFTAAGSIDFVVGDGSGDWQIIVFDTFNDAGIDGRFLDGSSITINQVPVPAAAWFLGSGLLSLFGLRRLRNRV